MKKEDIRFEIDQLRKDKMIYALESIALTFVIELGYVLVTLLIGKPLRWLAILGILISLGYFVFMCVGNCKRYSKIKKLEHALDKK
ncbi:hypothetical protein HN789_07520 [archaeon]|jgi:glucan phosphoethanolaminetransferase (alkaline phosphatase superfamily)|nr:hypothetical protein [archaeon]MBT4272228.1 hypothetical protein [archaeon]MBT4460619.1 hypothetical protein [archaeon]MBT4857986.1 hypothetical protein [archaeon]MBT5424167.1 hypothetical protein [archaeon]